MVLIQWMDVWKCFTTAHTAQSVTTISMMRQLKLFATCWDLCKCSGTTTSFTTCSLLLTKAYNTSLKSKLYHRSHQLLHCLSSGNCETPSDILTTSCRKLTTLNFSFFYQTEMKQPRWLIISMVLERESSGWKVWAVTARRNHWLNAATTDGVYTTVATARTLAYRVPCRVSIQHTVLL